MPEHTGEGTKKIMKNNESFKRGEMKTVDAISKFKAEGEIYKVEILEDIKDVMVSTYETGTFTDLCRGPHIGFAKKIKSLKLLKLAGAYWRGNEKNNEE